MDLATVWFLLWGLLWAVYFLSGGFDLGAGVLLPFIGKNDEERRMVYNATGPLWDGNEVWLLTAGGVTFAAFPKTYAVLFSAFYTPLMIILFSLIMRGVAFEFRGKVESPGWRRLWDGCMFVGSFVPALLFGVAFANIFMGVPIDQDSVYQGSLFTLLNFYGLAGGLLFLFFFIQHGALWVAIRTEGDLHKRAAGVVNKLWPVLLALAVIFLVASALFTNLYANYLANPALFIVIIVAVAALLGIKIFSSKGSYGKAWFSSALFIVGATFFGIIGLYPNMFPSTLDPSYSVTIAAASSPLTLTIMLVLALIFVPVVLIYQAWAYRLFSHKLSKEDLSYEESY